VALNCAALPETLVETELFGVEKGVATGVERRAGKFEQAEGGTIFLDEIGDLSLTAQAKILRALQERVVERVGGRQSRSIDVRVVAATNKDLEGEIRKGGFREDLYYRLNVVRLRTPSLREIRADVPVLARHFLTLAAQELRVGEKSLSADALAALQGYDWPGNVRQLENEMRRAAVLSRGVTIEKGDLSDQIHSSPAPATGTSGAVAGGEESFFGGDLTAEIEALERRRIRESLQKNQYNQLRTAKALGLSRQGLINKLKRYGIVAGPEQG
jgi:DNA-binding NtrC family response regulator